jgi:6-phosphogluconolactonase
MAENFELKVFSDDPALSAAVARDWLAVLQGSAGPYSVALSGGRIAKTFFAAVADLARKSGAPLQNVHFFWADERCVAPADSESNFRLAQENLFRPLGIAADKIHRLKGELAPDVAAAEASQDIRRAVPANSAGIPVLDLVFLGMGEDGHTASLMPNATQATLESREPYVHISNSPKPPPNRLTMTYPVLAAAKNVWALVPAAGKEEALRASLKPDGTTPFSRILQSRRQTVIYTTELNEIGAGRSHY